MGRQGSRLATIMSVATVMLIAACAEETRKPAPVVYRGTAPDTSPTPVPAPAQAPSAVAPTTSPAPIPSGQSDTRGVVFYDGYETIRAQNGDTVDTMAARVGLSGSELAAYNGLSTQFSPQEGDELVLPARADRYQGEITVASAVIEPQGAAPQPTGLPSTYQPSVGGPVDQNAVTAPAAQPTAIPAPALSSAPSPAPAQTAPASGSGWSAELARSAISDPAPSASAPAQTEPAVTPLPVPAPTEISSEPAPQPVLEPAAVPESQTASLAPAQTAPVQGNGRFVRPTNASVSRPFSRAAGPDRNDGIDFATVGGDPVLAADAGTIALISKSLGGLGTIVLIRHDNEYLSVYGRVDAVTVKKGDRVQRGQTIAQVANLTEPRKPHLHFEVRRGAESVDPAEFF